MQSLNRARRGFSLLMFLNREWALHIGVITAALWAAKLASGS